MSEKTYKIPIVLSMILHLVIFALLFIHFSSRPSPVAHQDYVNVVQAAAISESQIQAPLPTKPVEQTINEPLVSLEQPKAQKSIRQIEQMALKQPELKTEPIAKKIEKSVEQEGVELQPPVIDKAAQERKQEEKRQADLKKKEEQLAKKQKEEERRQIELARERQQKADELANALANEVAAQKTSQQSQAQEQPATNEAQASTEKSSSDGEIDKYKQMIVQSISRKWLMPEIADKELACQVLVHVGPGGIVINVDIIKESGDPALDRSATNAIMKASPLPVPENSDLFDNFRSLRLTFRPQGIMTN